MLQGPELHVFHSETSYCSPAAEVVSPYATVADRAISNADGTAELNGIELSDFMDLVRRGWPMESMLRLRLKEDGADAEQLDALTGFLRQELLQLDVDDVVALPAAELPLGARGWSAVTVGGLLIDLGSAAQSLSAVVSAVRAWLTRSGRTHRTVRLELDGDVLELSDASAADQDQLIGLFIGRHSTPGR